MMGERRVDQAALFYTFSLEDHVPANHLLRSIDRFVELEGLRAHLAPFYSAIGRPSIDPELLIRMLLVGYCFGIRSERRLCEEVHLNLAYRWFCRLGLEGAVPDHSTFSKNRHGRFRESDLAASVVRHGPAPVHVGRPGRRRGLRRGRQPDQGRGEPRAQRAWRSRSAARGVQPGHRRVPGGAGRRGVRWGHAGDAQIHLAGGSGRALDRRQQGAGLLRLCHQLPDRSGNTPSSSMSRRPPPCGRPS